MINVTRGFYKLPLEEKQKYSNLVNGKDFRIEGYGNDMVVSEKQILDWCDREITSLVLKKLAKLLGLSEGYLLDMFDEKAMTYARFNYYPRCPRPDNVFGLKPHCDASVITIVAIDDTVSGLQLLRQGVWYDVPIVPNALLINVGDGIESPVHRVVTNAKRERVSLAMFYTLDPKKELEPVPELVDDDKRPRQYVKVKTKDYARLREQRAPGIVFFGRQRRRRRPLSPAPHRRSVGTIATMGDGHEWKIVKIPPIVQELAANYVVDEQDRPAITGSDMPDPIPVIDLSRLSASDDDDSAGELAKLHSALENWGLFLSRGEQEFFRRRFCGVTGSIGEGATARAACTGHRLLRPAAAAAEASLSGTSPPVGGNHSTAAIIARCYCFCGGAAETPSFRQPWVTATNGRLSRYHRSCKSLLPMCLSHQANRPAITGSDMPDPIPAVGHGIEPGFLSEVMKVTRGFYELPLEEKQKYSNLANGNEFNHEGYGNDMVVSEKQILDWCDRLDVLHEYTVRCREITSLVLTGLAKLLGLREGYFVDMFDEDATTYARFNYYPRCLRPEDVLGLKPHSDGSVITVVSVDDTVSGLQVLRQGVWYDVPVVPNALLINMGDGMEIMSNGLLKSPVHRVVTNAERERVSVVMFYVLGPEKELEPAPELVDDEKRPRQYAKMKNKEYLSGVYETLARGTRIMSNGLLKSPVHRVVTNAERERVSVVMFYALDPEELEPAPELVDDGKRPR
uniref:Fe2OG dioxygenase domain-containing protein n=1 Tax=Oryza meridionalis TaxID=40149 RepID=A0A0E0DXW0_9ORYZ